MNKWWTIGELYDIFLRMRLYALMRSCRTLHSFQFPSCGRRAQARPSVTHHSDTLMTV